MAPDALIANLEQKKGALSARCIEAMYRDPFWQARFGDRGRRHAEQDSAYHVQYVIAALREGEVNVFCNYAVWLRGVLCSRGMCSHHLAESFRKLVRALAEEGVADAEPAAAVLLRGVESLRYGTGAAAELEQQETTLEGQLRAELASEPYRFTELASFLKDALARGDGQGWAQHLTFLRERLAVSEAERAELDATVSALAPAALSLLSPDAARLAASLIKAD